MGNSFIGKHRMSILKACICIRPQIAEVQSGVPYANHAMCSVAAARK